MEYAAEVHAGHCQISMVELFAVNSYLSYLITVIAKELHY